MQHTFGYARVSAADQNLVTQVDDLTQAGCTRIFQKKVSGAGCISGRSTWALTRVPQRAR